MMKNMIEKSVIEEKLAELENELIKLEMVLDNQKRPVITENEILEKVNQIDHQLTTISKASITSNAHHKQDHYKQYQFPIAATNG